MKHSVDELIHIVYRYYPRGLLSNDPRYTQAEEYRRLATARRQAGADSEQWRAMLKRVGDHFPQNSVQNRSIHLPTGTWDACYSGLIDLPTIPGEHVHVVGFMVSFLAPYYIVYSSRVVEDLEEIERMKVLRSMPPRSFNFYFRDTMFILPSWVRKLVKLIKPDLLEPPPLEAKRQEVSFDLSPDEQPFATWIAQVIEATWGYERMPPEIGKTIVPDVSISDRVLGEATLYDGLFSDDR